MEEESSTTKATRVKHHTIEHENDQIEGYSRSPALHYVVRSESGCWISGIYINNAPLVAIHLKEQKDLEL